jgi:hypothetical protein
MAIAEADGSPEALAELLKRFLLSCKLNENLDSWIPLSSDAVRLFFACLFLGLAEQLAKNVGCPKDKVRLQLSFACSETDIFSNLSGITTSRLITKLPDFGSSDRYTREYLGAAYKAGALSADVWLKAGISSDPSTQVVAFFKRWVNREASAEILNPQDIFKQLKDVFPFESNKSTDIEFFRRNKPLFRKVIFRYYPLDIGLISQFVGILGLLNWDEISENVNIVWSDDLIESFDLRIEWEILSGNPSISWSEQIIDRYRDKWDWMSLSSNRALPWNRG